MNVKRCGGSNYKKLLLCLLIISVFVPQRSTFAALFAKEYAGRSAGRPRFAKKDNLLFYLGIGVGINPMDRIENFNDLQLDSSTVKGIMGIYGTSSEASFTGIPSIVFGFVPHRAQFLRNNIEAVFQAGNFSNNVTSTSTATIDSQTFQAIDFKIFTTRILYELYIQFGPTKSKWSIFFGGGAGISSQINILKGTEKGSSTTDSTSSTTTTSSTTSSGITIASNYGSFAMVFAGSGGMTFDILNGLAVEIKGRYIATMTPFGSQSGDFGIYRQGVEIFASVLIKI